MQEKDWNVNTYSINVTSIMSINVFKKHPDNKIAFRDRSVLCCELKVVGSRPWVIFCVTRKCRIKDVLFIVDCLPPTKILATPSEWDACILSHGR